MRRVVDVVVVFIFIISIVSIFLLREGVDVTGTTGKVVDNEVQKVPSTDTMLFPNEGYDFKYCLSDEPGVMTVGVVSRIEKNPVVERYVLTDEDSATQTITYTCGKGFVSKSVVKKS